MGTFSLGNAQTRHDVSISPCISTLFIPHNYSPTNKERQPNWSFNTTYIISRNFHVFRYGAEVQVTQRLVRYDYADQHTTGSTTYQLKGDYTEFSIGPTIQFLGFDNKVGVGLSLQYVGSLRESTDLHTSSWSMFGNRGSMDQHFVRYGATSGMRWIWTIGKENPKHRLSWKVMFAHGKSSRFEWIDVGIRMIYNLRRN